MLSDTVKQTYCLRQSFAPSVNIPEHRNYSDSIEKCVGFFKSPDTGLQPGFFVCVCVGGGGGGRGGR